MTPTDELLKIVDHLIRRGATALEVSHGGSSVKANLVPGGGTGLLADPPEEDGDSAQEEFNKALYWSANEGPDQ